MKKRVLSLLMALTLCLSLLPTSALAEMAGAGTDVVPVEQPAPEDPEQVGDPEQEQPENPAQVDEPEGEPEQNGDPAQTQTPDAPEGEQDTPAAPVENGDENGNENGDEVDPVQAAQALIDALPDEVTADNADELEAQLVALDAALEQLTEEQLGQLDMTRFEALCAAMTNLTAEQANGTHTNHPICGAAHTNIGDHTVEKCTKNVAWTELTVKSDGLYYGNTKAKRSEYNENSKEYSNYYTLPEGSYYLGGNIELKELIQIEGTVNLCLNGYSITKTTSEKTNRNFEGVITINKGKTFSLCDCKGGGQITHKDGAIGRGVMGIGVTFNMFGGKISGNHAGSTGQGQDGAGVYMNGNRFNMYGGTITGNYVDVADSYGGGGVCMSGGTFTMYGGEISDNEVANAGQYSKNGGGIFSTGTVAIKGGTIGGNTAAQNGGGIYATKDLTISGDAVITGNTATSGNGGGVYYSTYSSYKLTVSDTAKIEKNTAVNGGGIYVEQGTVKMTGGSITDNKATGNGGGVYVGVYTDQYGSYAGTFNMTGGTISENTAASGGGVYYVGGSAKMFVSGNVQIIGNTGADGKANNVNVPDSNNTDGCSPFTIGVDGLDADAKLGITYDSVIETGKYITVALHAERGYKNGNFTSDSGNSAYSFKLEADHGNDQALRGTQVVNLYNGLHEHPVCGKTCGHSGEKKHDDVTWTAISSLSQITGAGYYYLTQNVTLASTWTPADGVVLCLNGKSITVTANKDAIKVSSGTFTLTDCDGSNGSKTFKKDSTSGLWEPDSSGDITVTGGVITHESGKGGGGVVVDGAAFTMYGGTICGNSNLNGGGVYSMGTFDLYGGRIAGNRAGGNNSQGGGVFTGGKFHMYGGEITDNKADSGGGVYTGTDYATMSGGTISSNSAANYGGGVCVDTGSKFTMTDGTIGGSTTDDANTAGDGGGVCVTGGTFEMSGGKVACNNARLGGGVNVYEGAFEMSNSAAIIGNSATFYGGGVNVYSSNENTTVFGAFNMKGGSITGNDVTYTGTGDASHFGQGGGVYVNKNAKMLVLGTVQIENNWKDGSLGSGGAYVRASGSANNLYLYSDDDGKNQKTVSIGKDGLDGDARIGVTTHRVPAAKTSVKIATAATKEQSYYANIFIPDAENSGYTIKKIDNALYLSAHEHSWEYTASGATITATCGAEGCNLKGKSGGSVTIKAPEATDGKLIYDGNGKPATVTASNDWQGPAANTIKVTYTYGGGSTPAMLEDDAKPTNANTYYASITMGEGNAAVTAEVEYTIQQATPTADDFAFAPPASLTYNGEVKTATVNSTKSGMGTVTVKYYQGGTEVKQPTNAGTYTVKIDVAESANYNAASELTGDGWKFEIAKNTTAPVVTLSDSYSLTYNKSQLKPPVTVTVGGKSLTEGTDYKVTYGTNINAGEQAGSVVIKAKGNYGFTQVTRTFDIGKRYIEVKADDKSSRVGKNLEPLTYTCVTTGLPYEGDNFTGALATNAVKDTVGTYQITQGTLLLGDNYNIDFKLGTYTVQDKLSQDNFKFTGVEDGKVTKTYGDADFTFEATGKVEDSKEVLYFSSEPTVATVGSDGKVHILSTGTTTIKVTASATDDYAQGVATYELTVNAKTLTKADLTYSGPITKGYDGSTNAPSGLTVSVNPSSLVNDDTLDITGSAVYNSKDVKDANTITFTPNAITTGNYRLSAAEVLTITGASITAKEVTLTSGINATDRSYVKDNKAVALTKGTLAFTGLVDGETLDVNIPATGTISDAKAGTYNVTYSGVTLKDGTTGKASNYKLVGALPTIAVEINQATPTVSANDITVTYDGKAIPADKITGTADVTGTWTWKDGMKVTEVADSGSKTVVFKPTDSTNYTEVEKTITVTINQATTTGTPGYTKITSSGKTLADAGLTLEGSTLNPKDGTLVWIDEDGKVLPNDTKVEANKSYTWRFTPSGGNYTTLTGKIELYHKSGGYYYYPTDTGTGTKPSAGTGDAGLLPYAVTALMSYTGTAALLRRRKRED